MDFCFKFVSKIFPRMSPGHSEVKQKTEDHYNIMSIYFDTAKSRFMENLSTFNLVSSEENGSSEIAVFTDGKMNAKLLYAPDTKRFYLFKGELGCADDEYVELQSYFFEVSGDSDADIREASSVANEFSETLGGNLSAPAVPTASRKMSKKERDTDEASAIYFVNRIPNVLPECREPLLQHKEHYEMLLPNQFCAEVVTAAVDKMLSDKKAKKKTEEFFSFVDKMYALGGLDVKSIITMTILNSITGEQRIAQVEEYISPELAKAWRMARRYIGKEVKPEKESKYQQMSKAYRSELQNQMNQNK